MKLPFHRTPLAMAAAAAIGGTAIAVMPSMADAAKTPGKYVAGDFHNHSTCSDGSISMQKLVKKATDKIDTPWGLDWFVQAGHGGSGNRNCTLAEDASLSTPAYPVTAQGPTATWQNTVPAVQPKGLVSGSSPNQNMWRWQSVQEFQYPLIEYLAQYRDKPLFIGVETVVPGHEHTSMSVITGQMPASLDGATLPAAPPYVAAGNADALAKWEYCFDRNDTDTSRGDTAVGSGVGNEWDCSVTGSLNATDPSWNATAHKLMPTGSGVGSALGTKGHNKTVEGVKWMAEYHPQGSYYIPAHLERAGPFYPDGNNGFNVEHLRDLNNAGPHIAFGFETQPGHGASSDRGEYAVRRNLINGVRVDSVGGTTWGGTGIYGAQVGGVWDALLGEGRNWWFFASSDWHNRGSFGPDDRRTSQDFLPGEYQRTYVMVRNGDDPRLRPQTIVDGLRTGNAFAASGQLIDRMAFVACAVGYGLPVITDLKVSTLATKAALEDTAVDHKNCATMGEKLVVPAKGSIVVSIVVRDPSGANYSPYTFPNPSLAQVGISQPMNRPVLDHFDVIGGLVTGYKTPGATDYSGQWPNDWITNPVLSNVPDGAKNLSAAILRTVSAASWQSVPGYKEYKRVTFRIKKVTASQYLRLRGTNLPASVPFETDASGNPLADLTTNASDPTQLKIPCNVTGTNVPDNGTPYTGTDIDGCPNHLATVSGQKYVSYDVAAWADLWFYSNPIYIEVNGSTPVAGVQ